MPHYLTCGFNYMGEEVRLHLNRNNPDRYRLPVYSITKDKLEEEIRNNLESKVRHECDKIRQR